MVSATTCQSLAALTGAASNRDAERAATVARLTGLPDEEIAAAIAERTGWSAGKIERILRLATTAEDEERRLLDLSRSEIERHRRRVRDDLIAIREEERQRLAEAAADLAAIRRGGALWGQAEPVADQLDAMGCRRVMRDGLLFWLPPSEEIRVQAQSLIVAAGRERMAADLRERLGDVPWLCR